MGITVSARKPKNGSPLRYAEQKAYDRSKADIVKKGQLKKEMNKIEERYGKGSQRSYEATKKYKDFINRPGPKATPAKRKDEYSKDLRLIGEYGADAMKARGFGTTYPKVKRNMGGPAKKRKNKSKVFSGNDYVREVNNYKEM